MADVVSLKNRLYEDMKDAMRHKDQFRLDTIRFVIAAIKRREIDERKELTGDEALSVLEKVIKQHRESIAQYEKANRPDLLNKEQAELDLLQTYLPEQMDAAAVEQIVKQTIADLKASSIRDMGKVMQTLKSKLAGKADMGLVSAKVKELLS